jgi:hypothetical protein
MPRLTFAALQAEVAALLADNTTGDITPADVRQVFNDMMDTFQPASSGLTGEPPAALSMTTTDAKVAVFDTALSNVGQAGVITPNIANDSIATSLVGIHRLDFTTSVEGPNNDDLIFTIYRNGTPTVVATEAALRGNGNRVEVTMTFPFTAPGPGPNTFEVRARLRAGAATVTFANTIFVVSYIPGQ